MKTLKNIFAIIGMMALALNLNAAQITASLASWTTAPQFVPAAGGAPNATKVVFLFRAAVEGVATITEEKFTVTGTEGAVTSVKVGGVVTPVVNGVAWLTGLGIVVPGGGSVVQDVFVSYASVGVGGVRSGSTTGITLTYIKYVLVETAEVATLTPNISTPTMMLVGSRPTVSVSQSGATLMPGLVHVGNVIVTADPKGNITVNQIPVNVFLSHDVTVKSEPNSIVVKNPNGNPVTTTDMGLSIYPDEVKSRVTLTGGYQIVAGTSQTFGIFVPITSAKFSSVDGSAPYAVLGLGNSPDLFNWTDTAGGGTTPITTENRTYLYGYPVVISPTPAISARIISIRKDEDENLTEILAKVTPGVAWTLESSVDFLKWDQEDGPMVVPGETWFISIQGGKNPPQRFFRLVSK